MKFLMTFMLLAAGVLLDAVTVDPGKAVIVIDKKADGTVQFAGLELQRHLQMMTGKKIPIVSKAVKGKYQFLMGKPAGVKLAAEEARWEISKECTRLYGDSTPIGSPQIKKELVLNSHGRSGDLYAVYAFLEQQLGFLFLAPGPHGTAYEPRKVLDLKEGKNNWIPVFKSRYLWADRSLRYVKKGYDKKGNYISSGKSDIPEEFILKSRAEYLNKTFETLLWLKQQRMGSSERYAFGHAFTRWWAAYGKKHPEYFALVNGKREPRYKNRADRVKLCVSNPAVWKQIVADWAKRKPSDSSTSMNMMSAVLELSLSHSTVSFTESRAPTISISGKFCFNVLSRLFLAISSSSTINTFIFTILMVKQHYICLRYSLWQLPCRSDPDTASLYISDQARSMRPGSVSDSHCW